MLTTEQQQVKALLTEAITVICRNGLSFKTEFNIEALIGITLDDDDVFLVSIRETVQNAKRGEGAVRTLDNSGDTLVLAEVATSESAHHSLVQQQQQQMDSQNRTMTDGTGVSVDGQRSSLLQLTSAVAHQFVVPEDETSIDEEENESQVMSKLDEEEDVEPPLIQVVQRAKPLIIGPGSNMGNEQITGEGHDDDDYADDHDDSEDRDEMPEMDVTQVKQELINADGSVLEAGERSAADWHHHLEKQVAAATEAEMGLAVVSSVVNITPQSSGHMVQSGSSVLDAGATVGTIQEAHVPYATPRQLLNPAFRRMLGGMRTCPICQKLFSSAQTLHRHFKTKHSKIQAAYTCSFCGRTYNRKDNLTAHYKWCESRKYFIIHMNMQKGGAGTGSTTVTHLRGNQALLMQQAQVGTSSASMVTTLPMGVAAGLIQQQQQQQLNNTLQQNNNQPAAADVQQTDSSSADDDVIMIMPTESIAEEQLSST